MKPIDQAQTPTKVMQQSQECYKLQDNVATGQQWLCEFFLFLFIRHPIHVYSIQEIDANLVGISEKWSCTTRITNKRLHALLKHYMSVSVPTSWRTLLRTHTSVLLSAIALSKIYIISKGKQYKSSERFIQGHLALDPSNMVLSILTTNIIQTMV